MSNPEARVFRPRSDLESEIIEQLLKFHLLEGHINRPSWTQLVSYYLNKDITEVRARLKQKIA